MTRRATAAAAALALGLAVGACGDGSGSADADRDVAPDAGLDVWEGDPAVAGDLVAVESTKNALAYSVTWTTDAPAPSALDVDCGDLGAWTLEDAAERTEHEAFVMGLAAGASCTLTARGLPPGDPDAHATATIEVAEVPDWLPRPEITVDDGDASRAPGWTLINLTNHFDEVPYTVALLDAEGRYRWYHQASTTQSGADTPVIPYRDGVAYGGRGVPTTVLTWDGEVLREGPTGHHEVRPGEGEDSLYILGGNVDVQDGPDCDDMQDKGSRILEYDWVRDEPVWSWFLCEHYRPDAEFPDWAHGNTVAHVPGEEALLFSARNQNAVMKLERATGELVWVLGLAGRVSDGLRGDFDMSPEDLFYRQHDPEALASGNILLFDNGHADERPWSRAVEYAYTWNPDGESVAEVVWEYSHDPPIYAPIWSDADRLPNGNTLVTFGQRSTTDPTTIVEVAPDATPVWEMVLPVKWGTYRSERVADPPRGFVIPAEAP